jgi:hypothetical protein
MMIMTILVRSNHNQANPVDVELCLRMFEAHGVLLHGLDGQYTATRLIQILHPASSSTSSSTIGSCRPKWEDETPDNLTHRPSPCVGEMRSGSEIRSNEREARPNYYRRRGCRLKTRSNPLGFEMTNRMQQLNPNAALRRTRSEIGKRCEW